jgi:Pyruvate/2-oxoacid:ferredoxin oxidoreductase gamma subunit
VVNSPAEPRDLGLPAEYRVATVDASAIAVRHGLGSASQPVVNTAILGAFARATGVVGLDEVLAAIEHGVPTRTEENRAAAVEAHEAVRMTVPA